MSIQFFNELPKPEVLKAEYPLSEKMKQIKKERDKGIKDIFLGRDNRLLVIVGPCSADNEEAVCEYISRLSRVYEKVKDRILVIPRIYTNKPRTTGVGYKGMLHQPNPTESSNLYKGIIAIRKMHLRAIEETGLTAADEMLYPENRSYLDDLLSYEAVGARSVENQQHRLTASGIDTPVGMKNPTGGDFSVMLNAITAAQHPQSFIYRGQAARTSGNNLAHAILRGYVNHKNESYPNYHYEDLLSLWEKYQEPEYLNPAVIIDTNHANSNKRYKEQERITLEVLHSRGLNPDIKKMVKGFMIESYLEEGAQLISDHMTYGKSITDPCLGFASTEELLYKIAEKS